MWAVFDGHVSHDVAGHAAIKVPQLLWSNPLWPRSPAEALGVTLTQCHESARIEKLIGGSTAVIVAATVDSLWCCFAGDSRAVAGLRNGGVQRLSVDHTVDVPGEVARIKAAGGNLEWGRVGGRLPMTRGIGDFSFEADGFACLPQVSRIPRHEVDFVVVGSDGLWDVMSDDVACSLVRGLGAAGACPGSVIADVLAEQARSLGSVDDIAVVVAYFPPDPGAPALAGAGA